MKRMVQEGIFKVLLYYQYSEIENPEEFAKKQREFCENHNLVGRIIISKEGINGTCAGNPDDIMEYTNYVHSLEGFGDLWFKDQEVGFLPFIEVERMIRRYCPNQNFYKLKMDTYKVKWICIN